MVHHASSARNEAGKAFLPVFGVRQLVAALVCGGLTPRNVLNTADSPKAATSRSRAKR
jgi:hypothetical protein